MKSTSSHAAAVRRADFFENVGVNGSLTSLNVLYAEYHARRLRLECFGSCAPSVEVARRIGNLLQLCREVRLTWPAHKVEEWHRLIAGAMSPRVAREAVILIHRSAEPRLPRTEPRLPRTEPLRWRLLRRAVGLTGCAGSCGASSKAAPARRRRSVV